MTATPIELRKIAYRQSAKDGLVITFAVHPNDMPADLAAAPIGTRFAAVLVEIGDDEQPVQKREINRTVQRAGILCADHGFQNFIRTNWPLDWDKAKPFSSDTDRTAEVLRGMCGIASRAELATNVSAAAKFAEIDNRFEGWKNGL